MGKILLTKKIVLFLFLLFCFIIMNILFFYVLNSKNFDYLVISKNDFFWLIPGVIFFSMYVTCLFSEYLVIKNKKIIFNILGLVMYFVLFYSVSMIWLFSNFENLGAQNVFNDLIRTLLFGPVSSAITFIIINLVFLKKK